MKVHLMSPVDDFDPSAQEPPLADDVAQDLQLDHLWDAMAGGDAFLRRIARAATLHPVDDPETIRYRQSAYADSVQHAEATAELYTIAGDALNRMHGVFMLPMHDRPAMELSHAVRRLTELADQLDRLRSFGAGLGRDYGSPAFRDLLATIARELDDEYMDRLRETLHELSFPDGLVMSTGIGHGGQVTAQVLRRGKDENRHLFDRTPLKRPLFAFTLPDRDEAGATALADLRNRSVNDVANAASQAVEHVLAFFTALRAELGFYLACGNLAAALRSAGASTCTPDPSAQTTVATGLYDPCLALRTRTAPVGNDIDLRDGRLLVITGANRGGKSTLLRALGTAQLMLQAGMPAPATQFAAMPVGRVFTHWAREEDTELTHGKLDEELDRMAQIVAVIAPGDLLLCNESFASTNEAEGSQILMDVTRALLGSAVRLHLVTHLYDFAHVVLRDESISAVFVRAPRGDTGDRSFVLEPGPPLPTSYGLDLYDRLFGTDYAAAVDHQGET